jgi:hypothetical protein
MAPPWWSLAAALATCVSWASGAPIVIGGTLSLTGSTAANGAAMRNASALFAQFVNNAGGVDLGVGGREPLILDISDDGGTASGVASGYSALLARGVSLFLGPQSSIEIAALTTLAAAGRPTTVMLPVTSACAPTPWQDCAPRPSPPPLPRRCVAQAPPTYAAPFPGASACCRPRPRGSSRPCGYVPVPPPPTLPSKHVHRIAPPPPPIFLRSCCVRRALARCSWLCRASPSRGTPAPLT